MNRILLIALLIALPLLAGCGTIINLGDEARPYGGVCMEAKLVGQGVAEGASAFTGDMTVLSFWPLALIDSPLTLVGDTLTLPITFMLYKGKNADLLQTQDKQKSP